MKNETSISDFEAIDYEELERAVLDSDRGRWFLAEFAKRNRRAETVLLLSSIERLERALFHGSADENFTKMQGNISEILNELDVLLKEIFPNDENINIADAFRNISNSIAAESFNLAREIDCVRDRFSEVTQQIYKNNVLFEFEDKMDKVIRLTANIEKNTKLNLAIAEICSHFQCRIHSLIDRPDNSRSGIDSVVKSDIETNCIDPETDPNTAVS